MPYNKQELLSLPPEERAILAEELWSSLEDEAMKVSEDEIAFAEERLKLHNQNPDERLSLEDLKSFLKTNMAFKLQIKPVILLDADEAVRYYEYRLLGLGKRFYTNLLSALNQLLSNPFSYSYVKEPVRRLRIEKFPYKIFYNYFR
jgi:putative addiction module component (TIGR02574 family)